MGQSPEIRTQKSLPSPFMSDLLLQCPKDAAALTASLCLCAMAHKVLSSVGQSPVHLLMTL